MRRKDRKATSRPGHSPRRPTWPQLGRRLPAGITVLACLIALGSSMFPTAGPPAVTVRSLLPASAFLARAEASPLGDRPNPPEAKPGNPRGPAGAASGPAGQDEPPRPVPSTRGASAPAGLRPAPPSPQQQFLASVAAAAQQSQRETGVPASVTIAQAILESDWGASGLAQRGNNFFGIKASATDGASGVLRLPTVEVLDGQQVTVTAAFRTYQSALDSFADHGRLLLNNPRYKRALQHRDDPKEFARQIQQAGYATDPDYATKLIKLMDSFRLYDYDLHDYDSAAPAPSAPAALMAASTPPAEAVLSLRPEPSPAAGATRMEQNVARASTSQPATDGNLGQEVVPKAAATDPSQPSFEGKAGPETGPAATTAAEGSAEAAGKSGSPAGAEAGAFGPGTFLPEPVAPTEFGDLELGAIDTRIQVVWPHDEAGALAPVDRAPFVNVAVDLFERGTLKAVRSDFDPGPGLVLYVATEDGSFQRSAILAQTGMRRVNGQDFPRWVFENVPVQPGRTYRFAALVDGLATSPTVWTHAPESAGG